MGCVETSDVTNFLEANNKNELIKLYNDEINRINKIDKEEKIDVENKNDLEKKMNIQKILLEDSKYLTFIVNNCKNEHVSKLKFLFMDYFSDTIYWKKDNFEKHLEAIKEYYENNKNTFSIERN